MKSFRKRIRLAAREEPLLQDERRASTLQLGEPVSQIHEPHGTLAATRAQLTPERVSRHVLDRERAEVNDLAVQQQCGAGDVRRGQTHVVPQAERGAGVLRTL
jgi:hypothetical protein